MKIQSVPVRYTQPTAAAAAPGVVVLEVSGRIDANNDVLRRARELIGRTGSKAMAESFDWAVEKQVLGTGV